MDLFLELPTRALCEEDGGTFVILDKGLLVEIEEDTDGMMDPPVAAKN